MEKLVNWWQLLMWRWSYAGYVMRRTRCTYDVAMRQAWEAQEVYEWEDEYPSRLAERRLSMWRK